MLKTWLLLGAGLLAAALPGAEITPKIVSTEQGETEFVITMTPDELKRVNERAVFRVVCDDRTLPDGSTAVKSSDFLKLPGQIENGQIRFKLPVRGEAERIIQLAIPADRKANPKAKDDIIFSVSFSSLEPDLFALRPWKGDFHAHSQVSDGKYTPFAVGAHGRRTGLDFFALADHRKLAGSEQMVKAFEAFKLPYLTCRGQEFHSDQNVVHSVAFGLTQGVNEWLDANREEYDKQVVEAEKELAGRNLSDFERKYVASARVLYRIARRNGAELVIFCHPYWKSNYRFNGPPRYTDAMLDLGEFDALEMPNGPEYTRFFLTVDKVLDKAREGKNYRFVGVSDSHDAAGPNFGKTHTVVFAPELSLKAIAGAVKSGNSVTVHNLDPKNPIVLGPWRQAKYTYFLLENYFPAHDEICRKQGELLLKAANGQPCDPDAMESLNRELESLNAKTWSK